MIENRASHYWNNSVNPMDDTKIMREWDTDASRSICCVLQALHDCISSRNYDLIAEYEWIDRTDAGIIHCHIDVDMDIDTIASIVSAAKSAYDTAIVEIDEHYTYSMVCLASDALGIYMGQSIAEIAKDNWRFQDYNKDDLDILLNGPDHEHYDDALDCFMSNVVLQYGEDEDNTLPYFLFFKDGGIYAAPRHSPEGFWDRHN